MPTARNLSLLKTGQVASVQTVRGNEALSQRLQELGFTPGITVRLMAKAAFGGALAFHVRGSMVALRRSDAACVEV